MKVKSLVLDGVIKMNGYIIEDDKKCFIVDPGNDYKKIYKYIEKKELKPVGILLTHGHFDHFGQINKLIKEYDIPVYLHEDEHSLITNNAMNGIGNFGITFDYHPKDINFNLVKNGDVIKLNDVDIKVIHTPGHTAGSVCYLIGKNLFAGDTVFKGTIGRTDLPSGSGHDMKNSLIKLLDNLEEDVVIYSGHGENTTVKFEKEKNFYYIKWKY